MKYKSEIYKVVHQDAVEMFKIGAISEDRMKKRWQAGLREASRQRIGVGI